MYMHVPIFRRFLGEDSHEKVPFLARFEGAWEDNVATWVEVKALLDLTSIGEGARGSIAVVVVHPLLSQHITAIIGYLQWGT